MSTASQGQGSFNLGAEKSKKVRFKLINNLIIVPVEVNGINLSFVLDTGVSKAILFNLVNTDSLKIKNVEVINLRGLGGDGAIEALKSKNNLFRFGNAINVNQDIFVVFDSSINFTPRLGVQVHGIIGYDLFKDFVVEINYSSKYIRLHKHGFYKPRKSKKWQTIGLNLYNNKPYLDAEVVIDSVSKPVKLLIDSGGSDALWLFEDEDSGIMPNEDKFFDDFLGKGLSGAVFGRRSKIETFKLGDYQLRDINVAFPDSLSINVARQYKDRSGSIAGNLLKRFNFFIDYKNERIELKKNGNFKAPFYYNNSGIVLEQRGVRVVREKFRTNSYDIMRSSQNDTATNLDAIVTYSISLKPAYEIVELRESSNAKASGLMIGDVLASVNGKPAHQFSLQEINEIFYDKEGKRITLNIERDGKEMSFRFALDNVFKK
ncbi:MAG: PDZ domain-containing protein [Winogradskyella sp.]|nr:aspartyl protease family protein [Bacteroidia bacterium]NNC45287.1 PDZ domain-containing protein [Winogradskyella sp.]NNF85519.1 PDZ domain-containing protein [Winogradskyella sp.]NNL81809.1 PDZ domain-containing protein [Winogradskyella sp.]